MSVKTRTYRCTADIVGAQVRAEYTNVREISGENISTVNDIFLQIFDSATVPANGASDMVMTPMRVAAGKRFDLVFTRAEFPNGYVFEHGVYICASSTKYTKTLEIAPDGIDLQVLYEENVQS